MKLYATTLLCCPPRASCTRCAGQLRRTLRKLGYKVLHDAMVLRLNDMTLQLAARLPPIDTRLRPDVRSLKAGMYDQAAPHYKRLKEMQATRLATSAKNWRGI
ncbi:hypothetical protein WJX75_005605 [Coccomyxa subellipsoidea]|uniref:Uncharacterized protein n=1 Tax=Coccomyxa subellipsoidea TaxID=248742 RepID=A0ABR2YX09_9CHLO